MKKHIIILFLTVNCLFIASNCFAQQLPVYSQYILNDFLLNPAIAGSIEEYSPVRISIRNQWVGFDGAPQTQTLSFHGLLGKGVGLGGFIFHDITGPIRHTTIQFSGAYHIPFKHLNSKLSFGLSTALSQYSLKKEELKADPDGFPDPTIDQGINKTVVPDMSFGVYYSSKDHYAGLSVVQLVQSRLNSKSDSLREVRHYFLFAGYDFWVNDDFTVEPSFLLKGTETSPFQVDVNTKVFYKEDYSLGISYRHKDAVVVMLGVKFKQFYLGYAYDIVLSNIQKYSGGSHEIIVGFNIEQSRAQWKYPRYM